MEHMNKPTHVLQVVDSLGIGGAERQVYELIRKLVTDGFRVSVICCETGPFADDLARISVPVVRLPWRSRIDPMLLARMIKALRRDPPQIVHTHLFKSDFHGRFAATLTGVPVVVSTLHSCNDWAKNCFFGTTYGMTTRQADQIIAVADEVREYAIRYFHIKPSRVITIPNGVDVNRFQNNESASRRLRVELGIAANVPLIGIVARLDPPKDHKTFLMAAAMVRQAIPTTRFVVVGEGPLRQSLVKLANELGLAKSVIFCGHRNDIPAIMSALDILVMSSLYEGLPVALLEGMAASRPIISTAVGGIPGLVAEGETGLLVPPANPETLAGACIRLIGDPDLRIHMGKTGNAQVRKKYSLDEMNAKVISLYSLLLSQHGIL
jgi:glycosyltransferase involved in cell wall biosynthesis